jgi:hypothetical protein
MRCWRSFGKHYPLYQVVLWCSFFSLLLAWVTWEGGHHYWIIFKHKARWPLKGPLFALAHYQVNVLKCKPWNPSGTFSSIEILQGYILVTNGLHIFGVLMGFQEFVTHFLDEVLFQMWHILMIFLSWASHKLFWAFFSSCVIH